MAEIEAIQVHEENTDVQENDPDVQFSDAIDKDTQHRYRVFKKNSPYLYDYVSTNSLLWPSLTVQFFPDLEQEVKVDGEAKEKASDPKAQLAYQRLLLGTFTLGQAVDSVSIYQFPYYRDLNKCINVDQWNFNPEKEEFELSTVTKTKLRSVQTINHFGDVNKLRYMPQNPDIIASSNNMGELSVYNRTKHLNIKKLGEEAEINEPQLRLVNAAKDKTDIFAFDWNRQREGSLVSGSMSGGINVYDIKLASVTKNDNSVGDFWQHQRNSGVNDLEWVHNHDSIFVSGEDDGSLCIYDTRLSSKLVLSYTTANPANSISVNPTNNFCVASGHSNGELAVYDLRNLSASVFADTVHSDSITQVKWHPKFGSVVGTSSADKSVKLHDMGRENKLLFDHQGHMLGVNDFDWSLHEDWMVASVADDNSLHVWKPAATLL